MGKIDAYINDRLNDQMDYYRKRAKHYKNCYFGFNIAILILSAFSSIVSYLSLKYPSLTIIPIISILVTSSVPVVIGINNLLKCHELYINYRSTRERLKRELVLFENETGDYENLNESQRNKLFINRCESIMATENGEWVQLIEKKQTN